MSRAKELARSFIHRTATHPAFWLLYRVCGRVSSTLGNVYHSARLARPKVISPELRRLALTLSPDLMVMHGPFRGLKYPSLDSVGSALLPKLVGSYEAELQPLLSQFLEGNYTSVVDIGCAEGYYAIGLAQKCPKLEVYAFDTNPRARRLCAEMAQLNGVSDRVHIGEFCDQATLIALPLGDRALIISDCEGYEGVLFDRSTAARLAAHDFIIETHDCFDIDLSSKMRAAFAGRDIRSVKSIDDIEKAHTYVGLGLEKYSTQERFDILREWRTAIMEWLVVTNSGVPPSTKARLP